MASKTSPVADDFEERGAQIETAGPPLRQHRDRHDVADQTDDGKYQQLAGRDIGRGPEPRDRLNHDEDRNPDEQECLHQRGDHLYAP